MELAGNEQRIRALFLELKTNDERRVPQFVGLWNRAELQGATARPALKLFYAAAAFVFVLALGFLVLSSRSWERQNQEHQIVKTSLPVSDTRESAAADLPQKNSEPKPNKSKRQVRHLRARRPAALLAPEPVINNAIIAAWHSPTSMLLRSPAEDVLSSLPQLTQSAVELTLFLPSADIKENQ